MDAMEVKQSERFGVALKAYLRNKKTRKRCGNFLNEKTYWQNAKIVRDYLRKVCKIKVKKKSINNLIYNHLARIVLNDQLNSKDILNFNNLYFLHTKEKLTPKNIDWYYRERHIYFNKSEFLASSFVHVDHCVFDLSVAKELADKYKDELYPECFGDKNERISYQQYYKNKVAYRDYWKNNKNNTK